MFDFENEDWHTTDISVDSLWLIDKRASTGKHSNIYHGNFVPQIPYQLIKRYTKKGDLVADLFMGSGTTLFECERLGRDFIGFDINPEIISYVRERMNGSREIRYSLNECDDADADRFSSCMEKSLAEQGKNEVDLIIAHPPYWDIVKFTDKPDDLSNIPDIDTFMSRFLCAMKNGLKYLKKGGYFGIVAGDVYKKSEVVPLGFYIMNGVKRAVPCKLKGIIVKNIEGNRGKIGAQDIWKYRALKSDYFIFKHEYVFVFKKE